MNRIVPLLIAASLFMGCKQYTVVDLSFLSTADQGHMKTMIDNMTANDDQTELEGKQLVIMANKCEKKKIRRFVDEVRIQTGFQRARWGP